MIHAAQSITAVEVHTLWVIAAVVGVLFTALTSFECFRDFRKAHRFPDGPEKQSACIVAAQNLRVNLVRFFVCLVFLVSGVTYFVTPNHTGSRQPTTYLWVLGGGVIVIMLAAAITALMDRADRSNLFDIFQSAHAEGTMLVHRRHNDPK